MNILSIDPSGEFENGSGTTGFAFFENKELQYFSHIKASSYTTQMMYWDGVLSEIIKSNADVIVCENFHLFPHKAKQQSFSTMETSQLIGAIKMQAYDNNHTVIFQSPSCKARVTDDILVKEKVFEKRGSLIYVNGKRTNLHERDAIRHGIYFLRYVRNDS